MVLVPVSAVRGAQPLLLRMWLCRAMQGGFALACSQVLSEALLGLLQSPVRKGANACVTNIFSPVPLGSDFLNFVCLYPLKACAEVLAVRGSSCSVNGPRGKPRVGEQGEHPFLFCGREQRPRLPRQPEPKQPARNTQDWLPPLLPQPPHPLKNVDFFFPKKHFDR